MVGDWCPSKRVMRFRATLLEPYSFINVLHALEKLGANCVLHFQPDHVNLYLAGSFSQGGKAFVEIPTKAIFEDYRIESKCDNEIPMVVNILNILRALKSGEKADRIVLKLTKKNNRAYLTFEISEHVSIVQDVPVSLQPMKRLEEFAEPELPDPEVQILMPDLRTLKNVIDRMKSVSDTLTLTATSRGDLMLQVRTDMVTIKTFYKGLAIKPAGAPASGAEASADTAVVRASASMSIKKFSKLLQCRSLNMHYALGCIVEEHAFVMYVKLRDDRGQITYYVPLLAEEE